MFNLISLPDESFGDMHKTLYKSNGSSGFLSKRSGEYSPMHAKQEYTLAIDYRNKTPYQQPIVVTLSTKYNREPVSLSYTFDKYPYKGMRRVLRKMRSNLREMIRGSRYRRRKQANCGKTSVTYKDVDFVLYKFADGLYSRMESAMQYQRHSFVEVLKKAHQDHMRNRIHRPHVPKKDDPRNFIGLEIEFISCWGESHATNLLSKSMLAEHVTLKDDGSIEFDRGDPCGDCDYCNDGYEEDCEDRSSEEYGHEIAILIPQDELASFERPIQDFLDDMDARVNSSCGIHVHIDIRHREPKSLFTKFCQWQELLYRVNPSGRLHGQYGGAYKDTPVFDDRSTGRYVGINGNPVYDYGTIEMRMCAGSTNTIKIFNWIKLLLAVTENKSHWSREFKPHLSRLALPKPLKEYFRNRIEKLHGKKYSKLSWWNDLRREQFQLLEEHRKRANVNEALAEVKLEVSEGQWVTEARPMPSNVRPVYPNR